MIYYHDITMKIWSSPSGKNDNNVVIVIDSAEAMTMTNIPIPDAPCMEYLPTFTPKNHPNVGKYTIHGASGHDIPMIFRCWVA